MGLFGRGSDDKGADESVALALAVGELRAEVAALRRDVDRMQAPAPPTPNQPTGVVIPPEVMAVIQQASQGHGELNRHLEQYARAMVAQKIDMADIIYAIQHGS